MDFKIQNNTTVFQVSSSNIEINLHRIQQRSRQIRIGKQTTEYNNYKTLVKFRNPKLKYSKHPVTPDIYSIRSKRSWDGHIRKWRKLLHQWNDDTIVF